MDLTPTIMTGASAAPAASSPAESAPAVSQEASASTPSGETQTTQAEATEQTAAPEEASEQKAEAEASQQEDASTTETPDDGRFDKHPRWKQMVTQRNEARKQAESLALEKARLEGQLQAMAQPKQAAQQQEGGRDFDAEIVDLEAKLDAGEMSLAEFNKAQRTIIESKLEAKLLDRLNAVEQQRSEQAKVSQLTDGFIQANPDFVEARDSGLLDSIIQSNPLHDSVSAYFALKLQQSEEAKQAAVAEAVKAAEERVRKEVAAKQTARTMTGSTSAPPAAATGIDPELANPEKFGGINAVLARRMRARQAASV